MSPPRVNMTWTADWPLPKQDNKLRITEVKIIRVNKKTYTEECFEKDNTSAIVRWIYDGI